MRRVAEVEAALAQNASSQFDQEQGRTDELILDEYIVVDPAGRLQIPLDLREERGIGDRVILESTEDGVLIRPVAGNEKTQAMDSGMDLNEISQEKTETKARGWRRWLRRISKS